MSPRYVLVHARAGLLGSLLSGLLCGLPFGLLPAPAAAQTPAPALDAPPEPGPPRQVQVPPLHEQRLPNGLTVVVAPHDGLPLVNATLLVRTGPEADPPGRAGLAEITAQLLTKGARRREGSVLDATALARQAEALGGSLDASSRWLASSVGMTVSTPKLAAALALIGDVARRPTLAPPELDRLREQALDGLRVELGSPGAVATRAARRVRWGPSPYGAVTTPASLQRLSVADARAFHRNGYRPDRALLVLAGDITPAQGLALARREFGDWRAPADERPAAPPARSEQALDLRTLLIDMPGAGQSAVAVVGPWTRMGAPDRRVAQVAAALLGGGYSARLNQEVRIRRGLSYGVFADTVAHPEAGMLLAQAQTKNESAAQVLELMRGEIARVAAEPASGQELGARKAGLVGGFARRLETNAGVAALVAGQWVQQRPLDELRHYIDEVLAVTPEQVRDFALDRWTPAALRGVVAGDLKAGGFTEGPGDAQVPRVTLEALDFDGPVLVKPR